MNCPCLLEKLLRLSAALTDRPSDLVRIRGVVSFRLKTDAVTPQTAIRLMGSFALDRALLFAEDNLGEWESGFYRDHIPPILIATHNMDAAQKRIWCSILALIAKLGRCLDFAQLFFLKESNLSCLECLPFGSGYSSN